MERGRVVSNGLESDAARNIRARERAAELATRQRAEASHLARIAGNVASGMVQGAAGAGLQLMTDAEFQRQARVIAERSTAIAVHIAAAARAAVIIRADLDGAASRAAAEVKEIVNGR